MADLKPFFDVVRAKFGNLSQSNVDGFNTILSLTDGLPVQHRAYILATCYHETAATMQPIAEYGKGAGKPYVPYYGRGYVQLTWLKNYQKASQITGVDLVSHPDLALRPDLAGQILINGMSAGWFTGKKLSDFATGDYFHMREIVNGMDRAALIAGYAEAFETALKALPSGIRVPGTTTVTLPPQTAPVASLSLWERIKWLGLKLAVIFAPRPYPPPTTLHLWDDPAPVPDAFLDVPSTLTNEVTPMLTPEDFEAEFQKHLNGGIAGAQALFGINLGAAQKVQKTFCHSWPEIDAFIKKAIQLEGYVADIEPWLPRVGPAALAFLAMIEAKVIPIACPVAAVAPPVPIAATPAAPVAPTS